MSGPHKKGGHEEGGGHAPAWIVSFADMVILLMSFFVLLLCQGSQKSTSNEDLMKLLASIKVSFGYTPRPNSKDPMDLAVMQVLSQKHKGNFKTSGQIWKSPQVKGLPDKERDKWVKSQNPIGKPIDFDFNSAVLTKDADEKLQEIAEIVRHHFRTVVLQGHCSPDEAELDPEGGHKLTCARANAVRNALRKYGVAETKLAVVSLSSHSAPKNLRPEDRQLVIVTIGTYLLPTKDDIIDSGSTSSLLEEKPTSSHGGH